MSNLINSHSAPSPEEDRSGPMDVSRLEAGPARVTLDTWTLSDTPLEQVQLYLEGCRAAGWTVDRSTPDGRHTKHVLSRPANEASQ